MRNIFKTTFAMGLLLSVNVFAAPTALNPQGLFDYKFVPNKEEKIKNHLPLSLKMLCDITTQSQSADLFFQSLKKDVEINGNLITTGEIFRLVVHPGDKVTVKFAGRAKLGVTNRGEQIVEAHCSKD